MIFQFTEEHVIVHPIFLPKKKGRVSILTKNVSFETRPLLIKFIFKRIVHNYFF